MAAPRPKDPFLASLSEDYAGMYVQMHDDAPKQFSGYSVEDYADKIAALVASFKTTCILDYGSGRGYQYLRNRVHERWGGILPHCYDVGVRQLADRPQGTFGGVICTDVMEHIAEADVERVLGDIFSFTEAGGWAFIAVSVRPAKKTLPDGRNVHLTVQPREWWQAKINQAALGCGILLATEYEG